MSVVQFRFKGTTWVRAFAKLNELAFWCFGDSETAKPMPAHYYEIGTDAVLTRSSKPVSIVQYDMTVSKQAQKNNLSTGTGAMRGGKNGGEGSDRVKYETSLREEDAF